MTHSLGPLAAATCIATVTFAWTSADTAPAAEPASIALAAATVGLCLSLLRRAPSAPRPEPIELGAELLDAVGTSTPFPDRVPPHAGPAAVHPLARRIPR